MCPQQVPLGARQTENSPAAKGRRWWACGILFVLLESTSGRTQPQVTAGRLRKAGKSQTLRALEEKSSRGAWLAQLGEQCHW